MYRLYLGLGVQHFLCALTVNMPVNCTGSIVSQKLTKYFDVHNFIVMYDKFSMCMDYVCAC